jgi:hypothetical protein
MNKFMKNINIISITFLIAFSSGLLNAEQKIFQNLKCCKNLTCRVLEIKEGTM